MLRKTIEKWMPPRIATTNLLLGHGIFTDCYTSWYFVNNFWQSLSFFTSFYFFRINSKNFIYIWIYKKFTLSLKCIFGGLHFDKQSSKVTSPQKIATFNCKRSQVRQILVNLHWVNLHWVNHKSTRVYSVPNWGK